MSNSPKKPAGPATGPKDDPEFELDVTDGGHETVFPEASFSVPAIPPIPIPLPIEVPKPIPVPNKPKARAIKPENTVVPPHQSDSTDFDWSKYRTKDQQGKDMYDVEKLLEDANAIVGGSPDPESSGGGTVASRKGEDARVMPAAMSSEMALKMVESNPEKGLGSAHGKPHPATAGRTQEETKEVSIWTNSEELGLSDAVAQMAKGAEAGIVSDFDSGTKKKKAPAASLDELANFGAELNDLIEDINVSGGDIKVTGVEFDPDEIKRVTQMEIDAQKERAEMENMVVQMAESGNLHRVKIEDLASYADVGEENEWGLRPFRLKGKVNFLDRGQRLLHTGKITDWFDGASDYRQVEGLLPFDVDSPAALVSRGERYYFFDTDGQLFPAPISKIELFYKQQSEWQDIKIDYVPTSEPDLSLIYYETFSNRLATIANRYGDNGTLKSAFTSLGEKIHSFKFDNVEERGWKAVFSRIKGALEVSTLGLDQKTHLYIELSKTAEQHNLDPDFRATLYSVRELEKCPWVEWGMFDGGAVIRYTDNEKVKYTLANADGKLLYPKDQSFDYVGRFNGRIALVRRDGKFNFIDRETGNLTEETWLEEAYEPNQGFFRAKRGPKSWNFKGAQGQWLSPERDFEDAGDFDDKRKAWVVLDGEEVFVDDNNELITSISVQSVRIVQKFIDLKTERVPQEEIKQSMVAFVKEEQAKEKRGMNEELHRLFHRLMENSPRDIAKWIRIFKEFRIVLNAEIGSCRAGNPIDRSKVALGLDNSIQRSKADLVGRQKLRHYALDLNHRESGTWEEIQPLPVTLMALIQGKIEKNPAGEVAFIHLMHDLERFIVRNSVKIRENLLGLYPKMHAIVLRSPVRKQVKEAIVEALLWLCKENDVYLHWGKGGPSVDSFRPMTDVGRRIVQGIKETRIRTNASNETFLLHLKIEKLARLAERGGVQEAFRDYQELSKAHPESGFMHRKMALAIQKWGQRPGADKVACEQMALRALEAAVTADPNDKEALNAISRIATGQEASERVMEPVADPKEVEPRRRHVRAVLVLALALSAGAAGVEHRAKLEELANQGKQKIHALLVDWKFIKASAPTSPEDPQLSGKAVQKDAPIPQDSGNPELDQAVDRNLKEMLRKLQAKRKGK